MLSTQDKLQTVLNFKLLCKKEMKDDAIETIMYVCQKHILYSSKHATVT